MSEVEAVTPGAEEITETPAVETPAVEAVTETPVADASKWYDGFSDEDKGMIQNNKWEESPSKLLEGYKGMLKLRGVSEDQLIKMPELDDADGMSAMYDKLGRPESHEKYEFAEMPEGVTGDEKLQGWYSETAYKHGLSQEQAAGLFGDWNNMIAGGSESMNKEKSIQSEADIVNLKAELGSAYDERLELGRRFARDILPDASAEEKQSMLSKMEDAVGTANFLRMFGEAGFKSNKGESKFVDTQSSGDKFGVTPEQAKHEIALKEGDKEWVSKFLAGDLKAKSERDKLYTIAYGTAPANPSTS